LERGSVSAKVGDVIWFSVLSGLLAYATIETTKRLTHVRGSTHAALLITWLWQRPGWRWRRDPEDASSPDTPLSYAELIAGLTGHRANFAAVIFELIERPEEARDERPSLPLDYAIPPQRIARRVLDIPPDQLVARIGALADQARLVPTVSPLTVALLGHPRRITPDRFRDRTEPADDPFPSPIDVLETQDLRGSLDELQVYLTQSWRRLVQAASVAAAGLWGIGLVLAGGLTMNGDARYLFAGIALGGPLAWLFRDLAATLERMRD
jgi:hypothetical protein